MTMSRLFARMRQLRIFIVFLALVLAYGAVGYSPNADTPVKRIDMGGVTGSANNTVLAFGRYLLVAPFAPSQGIAEDGELDLDQLDNDFVYVVDTRKPNSQPQRQELTAWDPELRVTRKVFFPSKLLFDPINQTIYVRGTRYEQKGQEINAIDVIAYVDVNLDENGKPLFGRPVLIDIPGVESANTSEAPYDFALSDDGDLLIFTNGATVYSFNTKTAVLQGVDIVSANSYNSNSSISFLSVDQTTGLVSVCWSTKTTDKDNVPRLSSQVSFFSVSQKDGFKLMKRVQPDRFPSGSALLAGSSITIVSQPDTGNPDFALFVTNDGSLCQVDFGDDGTDTDATQLFRFPELSESPGNSSPTLILYDASKRVVGIVRPGFTLQISRPVNGRGRISRPVNIRVASSTPALAIAKLNKKNKVTFSATFGDVFSQAGGLSNFARGENSKWLISTYSGRLYSIDIGGDLNDSTLQFVSTIGDRVDHIDYYSDRASVVAINSFTPDGDGNRIAAPGSLVLGKMSGSQTLASASVVQTIFPTVLVSSRHAPSIRRPCNIKR